MTSLAIALVLSSAFTHALWNIFAKRAIGGLPFIWLFGVLEVILFLPISVFVIHREQITLSSLDVVMISGSTVLHLLYFVALIRGYQASDLSLIYPFSRGMGPLLSTIAAVIFLHERPTPIAIFGTLLITIGVIWLTGDPRKLRRDNILTGLFYGGLTGLAIAGYTIWDSHAMRTVGLSPIVYQWGVTLGRMFLITPFVMRNWDGVKIGWQQDKWKIAVVSVFSSLSYILMLFALSFSDVSYVAPLRSISILMGIILGAYLLNEGNLSKRFGAAMIIVVGAMALGIG